MPPEVVLTHASSPRLSSEGITLGNIYALAHELIDPLTVVTSSAEIMAAQDLPEPLAAMTENIRRKSRYCQAVSMVLLGRDPTAGRPAETFPVCRVIERAALLGDDLARKGQAVARQCDQKLLARGDPVLLECALSNLIRNALQAGGEDCQVEIKAQAEDQAIHIQVSDNGGGVPQGILEELFERGVSGKRAGRGSGLGLWLSRSLLEAYAGRLELLETGPDGSTFQIALPRFLDRTGSGQLVRRKSDAPRVAGREGLRVLVVEDDPAVAAVISKALSMFGDHPYLARSIRAALAMLESQNFDAVTLDLGLGSANGLELYNIIAERWPDLAHRTVLCSAAPSLPRDALPEGFSPQFMRKPFQIRELSATVKRAATNNT
jgi:two-component system, sensor histidine kinase ChiS